MLSERIPELLDCDAYFPWENPEFPLNRDPKIVFKKDMLQHRT